MKRAVIALLAAAVLASGCMSQSSPTSDSNAEFQLFISDQPAAVQDFDYLDVSFSHARIFEQNESKRTVQLNNTTVDLTSVVGENATMIADVTLEPGTYNKIELHVASVDAQVDGESAAVKVPSQKLMITKPFNVSANQTTKFVFDISVVKKGPNGYNLLPVISESGVAGKDVQIREVPRSGGAPVNPGNSSGQSQAPQG